MVQVAKSIENSTREEEGNKDVQLQTILASEQKRDEMFFTYEREKAEGNRKHEIMMAQIILQATLHVHPHYDSYMPPATQALLLTGSTTS